MKFCARGLKIFDKPCEIKTLAVKFDRYLPVLKKINFPNCLLLLIKNNNIYLTLPP